MSFDYAGARQAGASDREIIDFLSGDIDFDVQGFVCWSDRVGDCRFSFHY